MPMTHHFTMPPIPDNAFDNVVLSPELKEALTKVVTRIDADAEREFLGMPVRTSPYLPEGMFLLDGPKQMAVCDTKTGKGYVAEKDRLGLVMPPPRFEIEKLGGDPFTVVARWSSPFAFYRPYFIIGTSNDPGPLTRYRKPKRSALRWRHAPHARKRDRR